MDEKDPLTSLVIAAAIDVHRELGPGLIESVYHKCMIHELALRNMDFEYKAKLPIVYKGILLDESPLEMDLYFPNKLVVELKSVEKLHPVHEAQLLTYLKLTKVRTGLLINFNVRLLKEGLKRMVLGKEAS